MSEVHSSSPPDVPPSPPPTRAERRRQLREARKSDSDTLREALHDGVLALGQHAGLAALHQMMEEDANGQCGVSRKGKHQAQRTGYRNGSEFGSVVIGGQKASILRPRVVALDGTELPIESYATARNPAFLDAAVLTACVLGVSQRHYRPVLGAVAPMGGHAADFSGTSKSSVGRRFIAGAEKKVREQLSRSLGERYLVIWMDAVCEAGYLAVVAVGLTDQGEKKVLGVRQGSTEDTVLCREFLEDLVERGLSAAQGLLFVVDGGKGLSCAIREVFGNKAAIQRCRVHKKRNILDKLKLSDATRAAFMHELEEAWKNSDATTGRAQMELLARRLETAGQGEAAASLREGSREMFTCARLGIPQGLYATLTNTNVIESAFSQHESIANRVKHWQNGRQLLRWVSLALAQAEAAFGTVGDADLLQHLRSALEKYAAQPAPAPRVHVRRRPPKVQSKAA